MQTLNTVIAGHEWKGVPLAVFVVTALLIALFVLRALWQRRKAVTVVVSLLGLWAASAAMRPPRSRPRPHRRWLLWLSVVAALAALFAATDLRPAPTYQRGRHVIVLVDEAAMLASQGATDIFAAAQQVIADLDPADRVAVVGFDETPRVLVPWQQQPAAAWQRFRATRPLALDEAKAQMPVVRRRNLGDALTFAQALAAGSARPEIIVVGPGGYDEAPARSGLPIRWARAASKLSNVGVKSFAATRTRNANETLTTLRLRNHNKTKVTVRLTMDDDSPPPARAVFYQSELTLKPREERAVTATLNTGVFSGAATTLRLRVQAPAAHNAFAHDDDARLVLAPHRPARVVVAGERNRYLDEALRSLSRQVEVFYVDRDTVETSRSWWPQADLVIFNEVVPQTPPTTGAFVYFLHAHPTQTAPKPWELGRLLEQPVITQTAPEPQKLLQHTDLRSLHLKRARTLPLAAGAQALASAYGQPLLTWRQTRQMQELVFGFSLRQSDLVWRPELPLLLENMFEAFAPTRAASDHVLFSPSHPSRLPNEQLFEGQREPTQHWRPTHAQTHHWLAAAKRRPAEVALGLACLCAIALLLTHLSRPRVERQKRVMALQLLALSLVVAALAGPSVSGTRLSGQAALLVEARDELEPHQLSALADLRAKLSRASASPVKTWAYGPEAQNIPNATEVQDHREALLWAQAKLPAEGLSALVLVTHKADRHNRTLAPMQLFHTWTYPESHKSDVALGRMLSPAMVAPAERLRFELPIYANAASLVTIDLQPESVALDEASQAFATRQAPGRFVVSLHAGITRLGFVTQTQPAPGTALKASVIFTQPAAHNQRIDNDVAYAHPVVRQQPRVLLMTALPAHVEAFAKALAAQGFDVTTRTPANLQPPDDFDLVVLSALPRESVTDAWLRALQNAVDKGVGLLVAGGPAAFAGGGWASSRLAAMLPLTLDVPAPRPVADLALALVVDRSGSMGGAKIDLTREAVRATSMALRASDLLTVIAFDSRADTLVPLQSAANRQRIWAQMERLAAGGGTNIMPALQEAYQTLLGAAAQRRHIIVLSDGHAPAAQLPQLLTDIAAAQITISAVAVGRGADVGLLRRLADVGGGRLHITDDASRIPRIFAMDVAQAEPRFAAQTPRRVRLRGRQHDLGKLPWAQAPALQGVTLVRARKQAELILETNRSEPLLVSWNVGAGQVAAFASDLAGPWLAGWPRWPHYPKFWSAVARSLLRQDPARTYPIEVQANADGLVARLKAVRHDGDPYTGMTGTLGLRPAEASPETSAVWQADLRETEPGTYEAWLPETPPFAKPPVAARLDARLNPSPDQGDDQGVVGLGHVAWPYAHGFEPAWQSPPRSKADERALAQTLARLAAARTHYETPLSPWLAALAALLFVAAIAAPRATFRASKN